MIDLDLIYKNLLLNVRYRAPKKTGNLSETVGGENKDGVRKVWVGGARAPYMKFTNEKWVSPRWHGKKNPNERWFQNAVEEELKNTGIIPIYTRD